MAVGAVDVDRGVVLVAAPHGAGVLRGDAAEPQVGPVLGRARLARDGLVELDQVHHAVGGTLAGVDDALHDLLGGLRHAGVEDLLGVVLVLVDHVAVAVLDARDRDRVAVDAAAGDGAVGLGHLDGRHAGGAQRQRRVGGQVHADAHGVGGVGDLVGADRDGDLRKACVGRHGERLGEGDGAVARVAVVLDLPGGGRLDGGVAVDVDVGAHAVRDGRGEREDLEARTRLAARLRGHVELALLVALAADHGADVAVAHLGAHQGALELFVADLVEALRHRLLGGLLHVEVEGGVDLEAARQDDVLVEVLEQQLAHIVGEVGAGGGRLGEAAGVERDVLRLGLVALLLRDVADGEHAVEHVVAALLGGVDVDDRVVVAGRVRDAREGRRLVERQLARVLIKVGDARRLDAVGALAVVDGVEVHHEDLVLGVRLLHLDGDVGLADLALERALKLLVGQDRVAHQLLRDGRGALGAACQLGEDGADDALRVDAVVLVETLVLDVHRGGENVVGDLRALDGAAVLQVELDERGIAGGIDGRRLGHEVGVGRLVVRQVGEPVGDQGAERDGERAGQQGEEAEHAQDAEADDMGARVLVGPARANTHAFLLEKWHLYQHYKVTSC